MARKKNVYVLDLKTGVSIKRVGFDEMIKLTGMSSRGALTNAIASGYAHNGRYIYSTEKFKKEDKLKRFNEYWSKRKTELTAERWKEGPNGIKLSNMGRIKINNAFYLPASYHECNSIFILHDKKRYNVLKLMAEVFILNRPLKSSEVVTRLSKTLDYEPSNLKVITKKEYYMRGVRTMSHEIAKIDYKGEIIEIYRSMREAERKNGLSNSTISKALKLDGLCGGMMFKKMSEIY